MSWVRLAVTVFLAQFNPSTGLFAQDYRLYHTLINNAEKCFFRERNTDSAFLYYDEAFGRFDFAFASDCFMAVQIAIFNNDPRCTAYIIKAYKNGIRPQHWKYSSITSKLIQDSASYKQQEYLCSQYRSVYLKRIHKLSLQHAIRHVSEDQWEKNELPVVQYAAKLNKHIDFIYNSAEISNFPGEKNIGIDQSEIMAELGSPSMDYLSMFDVYKNHNVTQGQFNVCEECIAQTMVFPLLVHHPCIYNILLPQLASLILTGQIHPREVAMLFDNILRFNVANKMYKYFDIFYCRYDYIANSVYKNNIFVDYGQVAYSSKAIDSMRQKLFINPLSIDSVKKTYKNKYGFKVSFGFWDCR